MIRRTILKIIASVLECIYHYLDKDFVLVRQVGFIPREKSSSRQLFKESKSRFEHRIRKELDFTNHKISMHSADCLFMQEWKVESKMLEWLLHELSEIEFPKEFSREVEDGFYVSLECEKLRMHDLLRFLLDLRLQMKKDNNYEAADHIRSFLIDKGIVIHDIKLKKRIDGKIINVEHSYWRPKI